MVAVGALDTACGALTADAGPVKIVRARVSGPTVIVVKARIVPGIVLPLIVVFLCPVSRRSLEELVMDR